MESACRAIAGPLLATDSSWHEKRPNRKHLILLDIILGAEREALPRLGLATPVKRTEIKGRPTWSPVRERAKLPLEVQC